MLPSLFILIALSWIYMRFGDVPVVAGIFYGIKPAVTALVLHAAHRIGSRALKNAWLWAIAAAAFVAIFAFDAPFPAIVLAAGLDRPLRRARCARRVRDSAAGMAARQGELRPGADRRRHADAGARALLALARLRTVLVVGLGAVAGGDGALVAAHGWDGTLTQMGWFFTKAALLTFGGAYAVLPYVYQGAVEQHQWLTATQMIDGLALGETTPGPLIMVVAFVGFVGGWLKQVFGPDALFLGGALAATRGHVLHLPAVVRLHPAGGPLVEATHGKLGFTAPLSAITAAVVGVILNLALFFAYHVLWPQGLGGRFDVAVGGHRGGRGASRCSASRSA